jgi:serine phosphatase RsbU (regulator of sigma subunit)
VPLIEELGRRAGIAVENSRLYTERTKIASALQQALLPEDLPDLPGAELEALYAAAGELNEVGGDFYDVFEHRDGRWVLAIGDVCGKGPRAAAVTALARHTLRAAAMSGQAPRVMIESVHQALMHQPQGLDMCTLGMILVDLRPPGAHLTIALAGHPQPVLVDSAGTASLVGRPGTLLGVLDPIHIEQAEVHMEAGDTLVLHTDGVTEAGAPSRPLGEEGLRDLCALAPKLGLNDLLRRIEAAAVTHAGGSARDDIALLALRLRRRGLPENGGPRCKTP